MNKVNNVYKVISILEAADKMVNFINDQPSQIRVQTDLIENPVEILSNEHSRDILIAVHEEIFAQALPEPLPDYLKAFLRKHIRCGFKIYLPPEEISRIWDIPQDFVDFDNVTTETSDDYELYGSYQWEFLLDTLGPHQINASL